MKALLAALIVLVFISCADATTWTCTKDVQVVQELYYEVVGVCTGSGNYTTGGGDAIGATATMKDTAAAVCHSSAQTLVDLLITPSTDGSAVVNMVCGFDHTNFKVKCSLTPTTPGPTTAMVEATAAAVPTPFRFRAVCK